VPAPKQLVTEVGAEEPRATRNEAGGHGRSG
jgi:hypothetical protein